jgi:hypothetical protein
VLPAQVAALRRGEVVFHHDAVEVVGLVLQAAGEGAGALDRDRVAELVLAPADGEVRPGDGQVGAGEGQAALVVGVILRLDGQGDLGVADQALPTAAEPVKAVVDEDGQVHADLRGGEAGAVGGRVGGEHVAQQVPQVGTELGHRPGGAVQDGVAPAGDREGRS